MKDLHPVAGHISFAFKGAHAHIRYSNKGGVLCFTDLNERVCLTCRPLSPRNQTISPSSTANFWFGPGPAGFVGSRAQYR